MELDEEPLLSAKDADDGGGGGGKGMLLEGSFDNAVSSFRGGGREECDPSCGKFLDDDALAPAGAFETEGGGGGKLEEPAETGGARRLPDL